LFTLQSTRPVGLGLASFSAGTPAIEQIVSEVEQETRGIVAEVLAEVGCGTARNNVWPLVMCP
jgi:hypothetical protein